MVDLLAQPLSSYSAYRSITATEYHNVVRGCLIMGEDGLGFDGGFCLFGPASPGDEIRINKSVLTKEMTAFLFSSCIGDMWDLCYVINLLRYVMVTHTAASCRKLDIASRKQSHKWLFLLILLRSFEVAFIATL